MLELFQKSCQNKFFVSFREQHTLTFSPRIKLFFACFDTLPELGCSELIFQER